LREKISPGAQQHHVQLKPASSSWCGTSGRRAQSAKARKSSGRLATARRVARAAAARSDLALLLVGLGELLEHLRVKESP
jgi:hypothetical protein